MSWRDVIYTKCVASMTALGHAPLVFAGGAITEPPQTFPFIVYRLQDKSARLKDNMIPVRTQQVCEIWVYDEPGSYDRIDGIVTDLRAQLVGSVAQPNMVAIEWMGESGELADDDWKASVRNTQMLLIGGS